MNRILFPILLIGAAVFIFYLYIDPTYAQIQTLKQERAEYDEALQNANQLRTKLSSLREQLNGFSPEQLDRLAKMLPHNIDNVRLILELDNAAAKQNMVLENISVSEFTSPGNVSSEQSNGPTIQSTQADFSVTGSYDELLEFLIDLERSLRIVDIDSVTFSQNSGAEASDEYQYQITVRTYWLKY